MIKLNFKNNFSLPPGRPRLLYQLAGVVPSPLLLELLSCPLCSRALEGMELDLSDLEGSRGEAHTLHDFPQGGEGLGGRGRRRRKAGLGVGLGLGVKRASNRLVELGKGFRDRLKRIVDSKYFNRGIMISILINTLSMGIEYHQQVGLQGGGGGGGWRGRGGGVEG